MLLRNVWGFFSIYFIDIFSKIVLIHIMDSGYFSYWCSVNSFCVCEIKIGMVYSETWLQLIRKIWCLVENSPLMENHTGVLGLLWWVFLFVLFLSDLLLCAPSVKCLNLLENEKWVLKKTYTLGENGVLHIVSLVISDNLVNCWLASQFRGTYIYTLSEQQLVSERGLKRPKNRVGIHINFCLVYRLFFNKPFPTF